MNIDQAITEISSLPVDQRLQIIHSLWDSIPAEAEIPVSPEQQAELDRRIAAHRNDSESAISQEEMERRIKERR